MPMRRCIEPGCGQLYDRDLTGTWRCPPCQQLAVGRARARRARATRGRGSTSARGYGPVYRKRRDQLVAQALASADAGQPLPCGICDKPLLRGQQIVAHHPDGKPHLADPATCRLVPAHAGCNSGYRPP